MTVVLLGVALTLLAIIFVIGFIARVGRRRGRRHHLHGGHVVNHHSLHHKGGVVLGGAGGREGGGGGGGGQGSNTLINKAFQDGGSVDQQMMEMDKSPDVIPSFNGEHEHASSRLFISRN